MPRFVGTMDDSLNMQKQYENEKNVPEKSNDAYSLSIRVQTTIKHISICSVFMFYHNISTSKKKIFFAEHEPKKDIARHFDASSVVRT